MPVPLIYLTAIALISLVTFIAYAIDKYRARRGLFRISEKALLTLSLLGGAIGGTVAMQLLRHKTKHWYFTLLNVIGILWQVGLFVYLLVIFGI